MKRTISIVVASAAVAMALFSCSKENISNKELEKGINADGTRTLTVSFATKATKTYLLEDGITPVWKEGDQISLNGIPYDVPSEYVGLQYCTITTDIQDAITAVYPADAYQSAEPYFKVKDKQDGSFGCANICVAQAGAAENTLKFENVTAVFAVAVPEGTTTLTVTSLGKIDATTGQRGTDAADTVAICTTEEGNAANVITVEKEGKIAFEEDTVYVAVAVDEKNGVLLADLNFDTGSAQGGVSPNYIKSKGQEPMTYKATAGTIYTPVLHEYVKVGSQKWATMNVGATETNPNGLYFMWGETTGIKPSGSTFTFPGTKYYSDYVDNSTWDSSKGFDWDNCPYTNGVFNNSSNQKAFTKYVPSAKLEYWGGTDSADNKDTLGLEDDAAFWNWGGSWRMPTDEDFTTFLNRIVSYTKEEDGSFTHQGVTFPAAGFGANANFLSASSVGNYLSSSLDTSKPYYARYLNFKDGGVSMSSIHRSRGYSVRPFSE